MSKEASFLLHPGLLLVDCRTPGCASAALSVPVVRPGSEGAGADAEDEAIAEVEEDLLGGIAA